MSNLTFAWWQVFILIPFIILVKWLPAIVSKKSDSITVSFLPAYLSKSDNHDKRNLLYYLPLWILVLFALARPQFIGAPMPIAQSGRDIILAIDTSGSMRQADMLLNNQHLNRLQAIKVVADKFIQQRTGDRIGLILFGANAYLQAPLTFDHKTVETFLNQTFIGAAGGEATAIGDAIGLTVKKMDNLAKSEANKQNTENDNNSNNNDKSASTPKIAKPKNRKVLIIMTDGQNNAGVDPRKATELAKQLNLVIYTIGMGATDAIAKDVFGQEVHYNPSQDLDESLLKYIAEQTGGQYFRAIDGDKLDAIYKTLDKIEPVKGDKQIYRPITELFYIPLLGFLFWLMAILLYRQFNTKWRFN